MSDRTADQRAESANWCAKHQCERTVECDCSTCHGEGIVDDPDDILGGGYETCWRCHGSGVSPWLDCEWCLEDDDEYY
jgi:DnaJ-class molecular chaperone